MISLSALPAVVPPGSQVCLLSKVKVLRGETSRIHADAHRPAEDGREDCGRTQAGDMFVPRPHNAEIVVGIAECRQEIGFFQ